VKPVSAMSAALVTTLGPKQPTVQTMTSRLRILFASAAWESADWHSAVMS
jgi:hypothetical protein